MKLFIYDKFWDAFIKMPKHVQKEVLDFQKKFRDDSKSSAIHLEPISTFKDSSLRTARVSKKYRMILKAPSMGDAYYLIWIDNHDEAMDWAKNKVFEWNETTQAMQVFTAPEAIPMPAKPQQPQPVPQQQVFDAYTDEQLKDIGVPTILIPSIRELQDLDDLDKLEEYLPTDVFENLFYLLDGANIEQLIFEVEEGKMAEQEANKEASLNNQRSFVELTDDTLFNEALQGPLDKWKYYLHPSQRKLVEGDFKGPMKVTGGAGTGKTVAALHRLKSLALRLTSEKPILFTTFTKALTQSLTKLADSLEIPAHKIKITNLDALAFELAKNYGIIDASIKVFGLSHVKSPEQVWEELLEGELAVFDRQFLQEEYEQVVLYHGISELHPYLNIPRSGRGKPLSRRQRAQVWKLLDKYQQYKKEQGYMHKEEVYNALANYLQAQANKPFSHAIVDELQDFSNVELRLIRSFVAEKPNDLFLVGDPLQTVYQKRINFSQAGINVRGKRSRRLRINYRTTEEIKKLAISIVANSHYEDFDGEEESKKGYVSLRKGKKPEYHLYKEKGQEIDAVLLQIEALLSKGGYSYTDIAIAARSRSSLKDFVSALHHKNIPYYETHGGASSGQPKGIRVLTFHGIKGLEFRHVFLVDLNQRSFPKLSHEFGNWTAEAQEAHLRREKSLLYVACSRAIEQLHLSGIGMGADLG